MLEYVPAPVLVSLVKECPKARLEGPLAARVLGESLSAAS